MTIAIASIGTGTPRYKQSQSEVADFMASGLQLNDVEKRRLQMVYKATGIEYRHSVLKDFTTLAGDFFPKNSNEIFPGTLQRMKLYKQHALPLAAEAIQNCFALRNFNSKDITHIITISCTGMSAPGLDIEIIQHFGLPTTINRVAINFMGCYGACNPLLKT